MLIWMIRKMLVICFDRSTHSVYSIYIHVSICIIYLNVYFYAQIYCQKITFYTFNIRPLKYFT